MTSRLICSLLAGLLAVPAWASPRDDARRLVDAHDYPAALAIFSELVQANPDDVDLLIESARVNAWDDRHEAAIALYRRVMAIAPARAADVRLALAWQLQWSGKAAEALPLFDAEISARPTSLEARHGRAEALTNLNRLNEALATYRQILRLDPADAKARRREAHVLLWLGQDQAALEAYQAILASQPDDSEARVGLGRAQNNLGLHQQAARTFAGVAGVDAGVRLDYARALRWAGLDEEALAPLDGIGAEEASRLREQIRHDVSSRVSLSAEYSTDSDRLDISAVTLQAHVRQGLANHLELGLRQAWLEQNGSRLDGQTWWLGYGLRSGGLDSGHGLLWSSVTVGLRDYDGWQSAAWKLRAKWLPADRWRADFEAGNDIVENLASIHNRVRFDYLSGGFDFRPEPRWLVSLGVLGGRFDDGNRRTRLSGRVEYRVADAPRLTLGVEGMGFNDSDPPSPGRGYYSPDSYREIKLAATLEAAARGWELRGKAALGELWEEPGSSSTLYQLEVSATHPTAWGDIRLYAGRSDSASLTSGGGGYWRSYIGGTVNFLF